MANTAKTGRHSKLAKNWSCMLRATYLAFGIWRVHVLHISRFALVRWSHISAISAFPDHRITLRLAFWLGLLLLPLLAGVIVLIQRHPRLLAVIAGFAITEVSSQLLGRSLVKFVIDSGLWSTAVGNHIVQRWYGSHVVEGAGNGLLPTLHSEVLGILRIAVNVCLFVIGTLGITVASQILSRYFIGELGQGTVWCYVGKHPVPCFRDVLPAYRATIQGTD